MVIKNIILNNFQLHKELILNFSPGVNVLIGETDSGKSAVIRALNLGLNNTPRGGEKIYLMEGAVDPLSITIEDFKGNTIKRENRTYVINDAAPLSAFNQDKPEAVAKIIRVNEVNFQLQIEPHFLILESGGNAAKILNAATGMEDQMMLLSEVKSRMTITRRDYLDKMAEKEQLNQKINNLLPVTTFLKRLKEIQKRSLILHQEKDTIKELKSHINDFTEAKSKQLKMKFLDELEIKFNKIFARAISNKKTMQDTKDLSNMIKQINTGKKSLEFSKSVMILDKHVFSLHRLAFETKLKRDEVNKLAGMLQTIQEKEKISQTLDFEIDEYKLKFNDLMLAVGACPLCGAMVKKGGHSC